MGDYVDCFSPSNRQRLRSAALYETAEDVIDDAALAVTRELYDTILKPTRGKWLGLLHGHHWAQLKTGQTTDQKLCEWLNAQFLGTSAIIRVVFDYGGTQCNVVLWAHHGAGSGQKACAPLNKLENLSPYWGDIDIFFMAHTTKAPVVPIPRITPRWSGRNAPDLIHKKIYFVATGGFSRVYQVGSKIGNIPMGDYIEQRMLNPSAIGAPLVKIAPYLRYTEDARGRKVKTWSPEVTVEV